MRIRRLALLGAAAVLTAVPVTIGGLASPALAAGSCVDQFTGAALPVTQPGTAASETLTVTTNNAVVDALGGNDTVKVGPGLTGVVICLGDGDDKVIGNTGAPTEDLSVMGGPGGDTINSGSGNDVLNGGTGSDVIDAGAGRDICKNVETAVACELVQN